MTVDTTGADPRTVAPSLKVTVPVGAAGAGKEVVEIEPSENVAVSWSGKPAVMTEAPAVRVGITLSCVTLTETGVAVAGLKVESPEYDAPIRCVPPGNAGLCGNM